MKINFSLNKVIQILLLFLFVANVGEGLFAPLFAVFVVNGIIGANLAVVGFATAIYAITKAVFQLPLARKIDKMEGERDDFYIMLIGAIIGILYPLSLVFIDSIWQLYVLSALGGFSGACLMAAYYAIFSHHADKGAEGFEWSLFSVWGLTLSTAVGGALGGIIADAIGIRNLFLVAAALAGVATLLLILLYPLMADFKKKVLQ
jgi:MFS family permease